jgi:site-specific DNA-methyltransferase (adenine-specific)
MAIPINSIINADCLTALPALPENSIDFILTDPPYLVNYKSRDGRTVPNDDTDQWLLPAFHQMHRVLKDDSFCVSFYGWPKADLFLNAYRTAGFRVVGHFAFPKRYTSTTGYLRYQHECAHLLVKGTPWARTDTIGDVIDWTYSGNRFHPTEKPIQVLLPLIETFCPPGGLTLDPFAGSGSTLVAARMLGRSYLGIELSAEYHAIAQHRLKQNEAALSQQKAA